MFALVQAWGHKCYWCRTPTTFRGLQIDHIIPRNPRGGPEPGFDADSVTNLAPICGPCNQEKGNGQFDDAPRVDAMLKAAAGLRTKVQRHLVNFRKDDNIVKALLAITAADLENDDVAEAVESFGALILPVFRDRYPQILDAPYTKDYTIRQPPVEIQGHQIKLPEERSLVDLDVVSRRALVILEDVLELSMPYALEEVRSYFGDQIDDHVEQWLRDAEMTEYKRAELDDRPSANPIGVFVRHLRHAEGEREGEVTVTVTGELEGTFTAHIEEDEPDPELDWSFDRRAEFDFVGEFSMTLSRDGIIDGWVSVGDPEENHWRRAMFRDDNY